MSDTCSDDMDVIRYCPFYKTRSLFTRRVCEREFLFFPFIAARF